MRREDGSAVLGFALVAPLVLACTVAVLQVGLTMHVRTVLVAAAAEGARAQARMPGMPGAGELRARELVARSLAAGLVDEVLSRRERLDGQLFSSIEIRARLPWLGLLLPMGLVVRGHALEEPS